MTDRPEDSVFAYTERWLPPRRFLCLSVKAERADGQREATRSLYHALGPEVAASVARANRVEPIVAHAVAEAGITGSPWDEWHADWAQRIEGMMDLLDEIAERAARLGIPVVVLKNGAIARTLHPCRACVPMGDLDLLVRRSDFARMHDLLCGMGFSVAAGGARASGLDAGLRAGGTDYALTQNGERFAVDLQWRAVSGRWLRADQEPDTEELISCSVPIPGGAVRMLAPVDNLIQVALHTAKHTYCRAPGFRLHLDVDRIVHWSLIDWDAVIATARRLGVATAVFLSLSIPRGLFGTPVPDRVLEDLVPGGARRWLLCGWLQRVSVFDPDRPKFSRLGQLVFQATLNDRGPTGAWRALFPPAGEMRDRHGAGPGAGGLLISYGRRFANVLLQYQR